MCNADTTIEHPRVEIDGTRKFTDGWGVRHQCKSWDQVYAFVEAHKGSNMTGILNPADIVDVPSSMIGTDG